MGAERPDDRIVQHGTRLEFEVWLCHFPSRQGEMPS